MGGKDNVATHVFATEPFDFPVGKRAVSVTLPGNTSLRLFTVAYS